VSSESGQKNREESAIRNYPRLLRRYQRLLELNSELVGTLELDTLLQSIVEAAKELTDSEAASILLHDQQSQKLYFEAATDSLGDQLLERDVPAENSIAGWVFFNNEPIIVADTLSDPRFFGEVDAHTRFQTNSILGVPLTTKDEVLGVIEAVNKQNGTFNEDDVLILQSLAAQASISIVNSRLFKQSDLVAEFVHEMRTPLASLNAAVHLLQRNELPQAQFHQIARTVINEVERLNEMATDFLEIARLESGRAHLQREIVHLGGLVRECLEIVRPQAEAHEISLESEFEASVRPIFGDRRLLKQMLLNLLSNAIKYNSDGGKVSVSLTTTNGEARLRVSDTGRGIPAEAIPRLFERFYRVPSDTQSSGTGLGLAIAKRITQNHGGEIYVESELNVGTTFTVVLPVSASPSIATKPRP
jgi:signal transduction histidine kinase